MYCASIGVAMSNVGKRKGFILVVDIAFLSTTKKLWNRILCIACMVLIAGMGGYYCSLFACGELI